MTMPESEVKPCPTCHGRRVVPDNKTRFDYPESRPCPDCTNGSWADTVFRGDAYPNTRTPSPSDGMGAALEGLLPARPDDWIDWSGGECPVPPDTIVRLKCRSGFVSAYHTAGERHLQKLWRHDLRHSPGNISAYKVFAEPPPGDPQ